MSEPQPTEEEADKSLVLDYSEFVAPESEDDEPEAMTGSAVPDPVAEILGEPEPQPAPTAATQREGYPITIDLDAQGNGSAHVGVFVSSIDSVEIDDVAPECIFAGEAATGISIIEVRGADTRSKPVNGFVLLK